MSRHTPHPRRRPSRRAAGLTLLELTLALAGTALIGTTIAAMLHAVAYGSSSGADLRNLVPKQRVLAGRINDTVRHALQVLEVQTDQLVVWADDLDGDGTSDSNELLWLIYDPVDGSLLMQKPAGGAAGVQVTVASNFGSINSGFSAGGQLDQETWALGLPAFEFIADVAEPDTRLVGYRVTVTAGALSETQVHAAAVGGIDP